jgi:hypothetical protein
MGNAKKNLKENSVYAVMVNNVAALLTANENMIGSTLRIWRKFLQSGDR